MMMPGGGGEGSLITSLRRCITLSSGKDSSLLIENSCRAFVPVDEKMETREGWTAGENNDNGMDSAKF